MPFADPERKREYAREWYSRPGNRERTIAKVANRKHTLYAGVCKNCGGPTVGSSRNDIPEWCGKPECRSAHRLALHQDPGLIKKPKAKKEKNDGGAGNEVGSGANTES